LALLTAGKTKPNGESPQLKRFGNGWHAGTFRGPPHQEFSLREIQEKKGGEKIERAVTLVTL
jgi:hypothetical protein